MNKIKWNPLKNVGPFKINTSIDDYIEKYNLKKTENGKKDKTNWITYREINSNISIHVENNRIVSIACYKYCFYNDVNIIGLTINDFKNLINKTPDDNIDTIEIENETQYVYEFEDLGCQVWERSGKIVTIFCCNYEN